MRIAQVAPLLESVPPRRYGGTERVVHYLTETLVEKGHDVTLFASGDSATSADLVAVCRHALRESKVFCDPSIWHTRQLTEVVRLAERFDIVHFHTDYFHFPIWRHIATPQVTTLHGRLDTTDLSVIYDEFTDMPVISISNSQRKPLPQANWLATVYNGIPAANYDFRDASGSYFAFLGRFSPEKGPEDAIEIARRLRTPLKMAAKIDPVDRDYFAARIEPQLDDPLIEFVGEVDEAGKNELLGGAKALLFPIAWPEPFGLVMTEAMACGTPVIAYENGSVNEVMKDGVTGFVVHNVDEAVAAASNLDSINRQNCRDHFERNFSVRTMADGYEAAYQKLLSTHSTRLNTAAMGANSTQITPALALRPE